MTRRENILGLGKDNVEGIKRENSCNSLALIVSFSVVGTECKFLIDISPDIRPEWDCGYR